MILHKNKVIWGLIGLVAIGLAIYGFTSPAAKQSVPQPEKAATGVMTGNLLPEIQLPGPDGTVKKIGATGKITILNFWATWCPPCREEMPELGDFVHQYGSAVDFYAVNIQETPEQVAAFLAQGKLILPVLFDKEGTVARSFRISAIPTTLIADKKGVIRFRKTGGVTRSEMEKVVKSLAED